MNYFLFKHVDYTFSPVCGMAVLNPGWCHIKRKLETESVLIFGKKNTTLITEEGNTLEVKPGRMILLPANRLHFGKEAIKQSVSYYWIHFFQTITTEDEKRYFLPKLMEEKEALTILSSPQIYYERLKDSIILPQVIDTVNSVPFNNLFNEILSEFKNPGFSPLIYKNLVVKLLLEFSRECFNSESIKSNAQEGSAVVNKILVILEEELSNPNASVKYFADKLKLNADYIGRCFKEAMHISIGQYIARRRIDVACTRLRETYDSIDNIASFCGFGSRREFYDEFKKITGKTPALYRSESAVIGINTL